MNEYEEKIHQWMIDPTTSYRLKLAFHQLDDMDVVDALNGIDVLAQILREKHEMIRERALR